MSVLNPLDVSLSTSWNTVGEAWFEALTRVPCLGRCPDNFHPDEPCLSSYLQTWEGYNSAEYSTISNEVELSSAISIFNSIDHAFLECICQKTGLQPWLSGATGVCDHGTYTSCANPASTDLVVLTDIHEEFTSMCNSVFTIQEVEATTTATSEESTSTEATTSNETTNSAEVPEETGSGQETGNSEGSDTGNESGDGNTSGGGNTSEGSENGPSGDGDGDSSAGKGFVSLTGALLATFVGLAAAL